MDCQPLGAASVVSETMTSDDPVITASYKRLQKAINAVLAANGLSQISADGQIGSRTLSAAILALGTPTMAQDRVLLMDFMGGTDVLAINADALADAFEHPSTGPLPSPKIPRIAWIGGGVALALAGGFLWWLTRD